MGVLLGSRGRLCVGLWAGVVLGSACGGQPFSVTDDGGAGASAAAGSAGLGSGGVAGASGAAGTSGSGGATGSSGASGAAGSSGSAGAGGSSGSSGSGAGGGSGAAGASGAPGPGVCLRSSDCTLYSDCCSCRAMAAGETPAACGLACIINSCEAAGISSSDVRCVAGRCVLNRSCNSSNKTCTTPPPLCTNGSVPVTDSSCYTGQCLPADQCSEVTSCSVCSTLGLACVTFDFAEPSYHCVSTPPSCKDSPTCSCMAVCTASGIACQAPDSTTLSCCQDC